VAASKRPADPAASFDASAPLRKLGEAARLQQAGELDGAEAAYAALLRDHPDDATALINGGVLAVRRGDTATAIDRLARAVRLLPRNAIARNNLGFARLHAADDARALADFDAAVRLQPGYAQAHNNRGIALVRLRRDADARNAFARALALDGKAIDAALNLADLEARLGRADDARAAFDRALAIDPQSVAARAGRAFADALGGDLEGSLASLDALVAERPDAHGAWKTLGAVANWSWRHDAAERAFRAAHAHKPDDDEAAFGIASTLLARGRHAEGFAAFERRREGSASAVTRFGALPAWDGEPMSGTLLLYAEQGLGDVVQFARFIGDARERVGEVVLLLDGYWRSLAPLLASAHGVDRIAESVDALGQHDLAARASLLSLPHLLGATPESAPAHAYLSAPTDRRAAWAERLRDLPHPRVGLAWSVFARSDYGYVTQHKSVPVRALASLFAVPGVRFVTLQPGSAGDPCELRALGASIVDPREHIGDFGDTAALIETLDLVIAPDTAVAHVAGALGAPVWMLDRYNSCWRWRHPGGERTPWYASMRIFRQARFGDWTDPVARAAAALRELARAP